MYKEFKKHVFEYNLSKAFQNIHLLVISIQKLKLMLINIIVV